MRFNFFNFFDKKILEPKAEFPFWSGDNMISFDGEKTPYELGNPVGYYLDYYAIRLRSWEAYLKSDILQNAIKKYLLWIIGSGLKLQATPESVILENEKINFNEKQFNSLTEAYFRLFAKQKESSYSDESNLHNIAKEALKNAIISGDVLVIQRLENGIPKIQIIDGYHVQNPLSNNILKEIEKRGNRLEDGVELNKKGTHIAYYVNNKKILARKKGQRYAWLMYGLNYKQDTVRGMSLLTAILETASKMDRYKDATIGNAEENSKIPYTINHNQFSTGENPMIQQLAQSMSKKKGVAPETDSYTESEEQNLASKIAQTTSKQTYNMPIGSELKRNDFETDMNFKDFFMTNADIVYSTFGIPPEVALDKFGGSYSGSRAALKSWEYKMLVDRELLLTEQFYKPFYNFWLDIQVLKNKIKESGYLSAYYSKNYIILAAYRNCRFIGATVPHIDPYKEVNAERLKLGNVLSDIPLTTAEQSCENLNTGDYLTILKKAETEKELSGEFIISNDTEKEIETK